MGAAGNKVLLELGGVPILAWTIDALVAAEAIDEIVLVSRPEERAAIDALVRDRVAPARVLVHADGGAERADSVANGLAAVGGETDLVLVHDAARPFVLPSLVRTLVAAAASAGAAIPALPIVDTLKRRRDGFVVETVDRSELVRAQTPQAFRREVLEGALAARGDAAPTDDAAAVEAAGGSVALVDGDPLNLKVTTPDDLRLAEAILPLFRRRRAEEGRR